MDSVETAATAVVVAFAFFVRGVTGFGSATVAVPVLAHFVPLQVAVPLLLVLDFASSIVLARLDRSRVDLSEVAWLLPFALAGAILGVTLLVSLPAQWLLAALGVVVAAFGARAFVRPGAGGCVARGWVVPAGLAGGTLGGLFGSGAATPFMIYLMHRLPDRVAVRATFSAFAVLDYGLRIAVFALAGLLFTGGVGFAVLLGLPAMAAGLYVGNRVHGRISDSAASKAVGTLLVAGGGSLLVKAALL